MKQYRPSAERTRSARWRSGTRRNKKHPVAHILLCPMPTVCLVHRHGDFPRHPAMAMKLTRCEQKWVDDVRAERVHVHLTRMSSRQAQILLIRQRINTERFKQAGIVNELSPPIMASIVTPPVATASVHRQVKSLAEEFRKYDISDRWYPRGS